MGTKSREGSKGAAFLPSLLSVERTCRETADSLVAANGLPRYHLYFRNDCHGSVPPLRAGGIIHDVLGPGHKGPPHLHGCQNLLGFFPCLSPEESPTHSSKLSFSVKFCGLLSSSHCSPASPVQAAGPGRWPRTGDVPHSLAWGSSSEPLHLLVQD